MTYVFRNHAVEYLFNPDCVFSGYGDISNIPIADEYLWFYQLPIEFDEDILVKTVDSFSRLVEMVAKEIDKNRLFIICSLDIYHHVSAVSGDNRLRQAVDGYNLVIRHLSDINHNIKVIEIAEFHSRYSVEELFNARFYFTAQLPYNPRLRSDFKCWMEQKRREIALHRKKCLILDLDNTIWAGVVGEDGTSGIKVGGNYPGNAFFLWQQGLKFLRQNGVILAICSKNNLSDINDVWETHPDMPLKSNDFAAVRINWLDKVSNIRSLAEELNIGLDSMVFVDDNPSERELVKGLLPEVAVPAFPEQPFGLIDYYNSLVSQFFSVYTLSVEDSQKTEQYLANHQREEAIASFNTFEDYLKWLEIQLHIFEMTPSSRIRTAQMTQKTNQFNLTTHRYSEQDLQQMQNDGARVFLLSVSDRLGEQGITGCIIVKSGLVDTFLLSCRVLGRGIEQAFFLAVAEKLRCEGFRSIEADYLPTKKNVQVASFFDALGANLIKSSKDGSKHYSLDLDSFMNKIPYYYTVSWT